MIRSDYNHQPVKKRTIVDPKKRQFADARWKDNDYATRLNFYSLPPTAQVTLDEFEQWAIMRLKGIFACRWEKALKHFTNLAPSTGSPVGAGNMHVPQQDARGNPHLHDPDPRKTPASPPQRFPIEPSTGREAT
jgi:hypothetical protein